MINTVITDAATWLTQAVLTVNGWVWSSALVALCLLSGLYFSLRTRFVQVRRLGEMVRLLFHNDKKQKNLPEFALNGLFAGR